MVFINICPTGRENDLLHIAAPRVVQAVSQVAQNLLKMAKKLHHEVILMASYAPHMLVIRVL